MQSLSLSAQPCSECIHGQSDIGCCIDRTAAGILMARDRQPSWSRLLCLRIASRKRAAKDTPLIWGLRIFLITSDHLQMSFSCWPWDSWCRPYSPLPFCLRIVGLALSQDIHIHETNRLRPSFWKWNTRKICPCEIMVDCSFVQKFQSLSGHRDQKMRWATIKRPESNWLLVSAYNFSFLSQIIEEWLVLFQADVNE